MVEISTEVQIHAPASKVWEVLIDFVRHPEWNPFIKQISGTLKEGETLSVTLQSPSGKGMKFTPRVISVVPQKELCWLGKLFLKGIFDGLHSFVIEEIEPGRVRFIHSERFSGILVPLFQKSLETGTRQGFENMNLALKKVCETSE